MNYVCKLDNELLGYHVVILGYFVKAGFARVIKFIMVGITAMFITLQDTIIDNIRAWAAFLWFHHCIQYC